MDARMTADAREETMGDSNFCTSDIAGGGMNDSNKSIAPLHIP